VLYNKQKMLCIGGSKALKDFEKLCLETACRLGRTLEQKEVEFLAWLYDRYEEESKRKTVENVEFVSPLKS